MIQATLRVAAPGTPIRAYLGGVDHSVPIVELGSPGEFQAWLDPSLTPHEQVAFLRRLSAQVEALAVSVATAHAVPVSGVAS